LKHSREERDASLIALTHSGETFSSDFTSLNGKTLHRWVAGAAVRHLYFLKQTFSWG
jgi:hypothetical protein